MLHNKIVSGIGAIAAKCIYHKLSLWIAVSLFLSFVAQAQWTVNNEKAKRLVVDTYQPVNILSGDLPEGGMFVVWMDKKESIEQEILIQAIDVNGRARLRADGRKITELAGKKELPVLKVSSSGVAYVLWKDYTYNAIGDLYMQKIQSNGIFDWGDYGHIVAICRYSPVVYSMALDSTGFAYSAFVEKIDSSGIEYVVKLQKVSPDGVNVFLNDGVTVATSRSSKTNIQVCPDTSGGAYIFWIEARAGKSVIVMQHVNAEGKFLLSKKSVDITQGNTNIINYTATRFVSGEILTAWQTGPKLKEIYYQIIQPNGKALFADSKLVSPAVKAAKSNLSAVPCADSTIMIGWIAEKTPSKKEVMLQKISRHGAILWGDDGEVASMKPSIKYSGSISVDRFSNVYAAWIERKDLLSSEFVYGQKLNSNGVRQWETEGTPILVSKNSEKSYLTSFADKRQGMVVVLREGKRSGTEKNARTEYGIFGQRLYAERNAVGVLSEMNATVDMDNVVVSWKSSNETNVRSYKIEKFLLKTVRDTSWSEVAVVPAKPFSGVNEYRYSFTPDSDGVYFIRVVQLVGNSPIAASEIQKVSYLRDFGDKIVVLQNNPNPFPDSTVINYYLPRKMPVRLEFYNSRIEKIDEVNLIDTRRGRNSYTFSADKLPDGIYFFRFTADDVLEVKKFVIAR